MLVGVMNPWSCSDELRWATAMHFLEEVMPLLGLSFRDRTNLGTRLVYDVQVEKCEPELSSGC